MVYILSRGAQDQMRRIIFKWKRDLGLWQLDPRQPRAVQIHVFLLYSKAEKVAYIGEKNIKKETD